jgi:hypothetical protein
LHVPASHTGALAPQSVLVRHCTHPVLVQYGLLGVAEQSVPLPVQVVPVQVVPSGALHATVSGLGQVVTQHWWLLHVSGAVHVPQ